VRWPRRDAGPVQGRLGLVAGGVCDSSLTESFIALKLRPERAWYRELDGWRRWVRSSVCLPHRNPRAPPTGRRLAAAPVDSSALLHGRPPPNAAAVEPEALATGLRWTPRAHSTRRLCGYAVPEPVVAAGAAARRCADVQGAAVSRGSGRHQLRTERGARRPLASGAGITRAGCAEPWGCMQGVRLTARSTGPPPTWRGPAKHLLMRCWKGSVRPEFGIAGAAEVCGQLIAARSAASPAPGRRRLRLRATGPERAAAGHLTPRPRAPKREALGPMGTRQGDYTPKQPII
jgi:hypothetical protein